MAPNFRQNAQTRRGNRGGYVELDDFEVRQWRQEWVNVTPPPPPDPTHKSDLWEVELPHGMPKDSHLLPPHTQELLRAARSGRLYKRPAPTEEEELEPDAAISDKAEKKEDDLSTKGFRVRMWKQVPRNAEGPTVSYLAKRKKGTITLSSELPAGAGPGPTITKATVRRIDAAGNPYTQEVTLNEGQPVDGEIISTTVVAAPNPVTSRDTSAAVTPMRRRPPPPKRRPRGPGRGRRRKLPLPTSTRSDMTNPAATGLVQGLPTDAAQDLKPDDDTSKNNDSEMADDDEGDDGEDGEDDGDDGDDDDEDGDAADGETRSVSRADSETRSDQMDLAPSRSHGEYNTAGITLPPPGQELSSTANMNLSVPQPPTSHVEGSPLKQVVLAQSSGSSPQNSLSDEYTPTLSVEPTIGLAADTNVETLADSSEANNIPITDEGGAMFMDFDMPDAPPVFAESITKTAPLADMDPSVALTDAPAVESSDQTAAGFVATDKSRNQVDTTMESTLERAEIQEGQTQSSKDTTDAKPPTPPAAHNTTDHLVAPAADGSSPDKTSFPSASLVESQDERPTLPTHDDITPNSPDLFSGLEAALNEHGPDSNEPAQQTSESAS
ncbi:hypothetical protein GGR50DRAFT_664242 [Xylaria sp. CBS 124048]|nr:hypothetical protein GGR50DRAFT_664242 [Xylaria sp. CBS 124048]